MEIVGVNFGVEEDKTHDGMAATDAMAQREDGAHVEIGKEYLNRGASSRGGAEKHSWRTFEIKTLGRE